MSRKAQLRGLDGGAVLALMRADANRQTAYERFQSYAARARENLMTPTSGLSLMSAEAARLSAAE